MQGGCRAWSAWRKHTRAQRVQLRWLVPARLEMSASADPDASLCKLCVGCCKGPCKLLSLTATAIALHSGNWSWSNSVMAACLAQQRGDDAFSAFCRQRASSREHCMRHRGVLQGSRTCISQHPVPSRPPALLKTLEAPEGPTSRFSQLQQPRCTQHSPCIPLQQPRHIRCGPTSSGARCRARHAPRHLPSKRQRAGQPQQASPGAQHSPQPAEAQQVSRGGQHPAEGGQHQRDRGGG